MKLSLNTDFTKLPRAGSVVTADHAAGAPEPFDAAILPHDERHLRRRVIDLAGGSKILIDLPEPVMLGTGDRLVLDDGSHALIMAAEEELYDIRPRDRVHLAELAWHIGNRHLAAAIEPDRILILRDHVIKAMLQGLGATVTDIVEPFEPVRGAYSGHAGHDHGHGGHGSHEHEHEPAGGERDRFGRQPGDAHYGHNHGPEGDHHPHQDHHGHAHGGGARDRFGRLPGDPHYGHNHD